jgi:hypothetical protein
MSTITLKLDLTLRRFAVIGTIFLPRGRHAETTIHSALLSFRSHIDPPFGGAAKSDAEWTVARCRELELSAGFQQVGGVFQACFSKFGAAQHTGDFLGTFGVFHAPNLRLRAAALLNFFDEKMLVHECRDLG